MRVPAHQIRRQLVSVFQAWGMSSAHAETTADMMVETDLREVDSHGLGMLPTYDQEFRNGRLNMRPLFKKARETAATALVDADRSLGHPAASYAMNLAVDKCLVAGVGVVAVFNSHHFGAAGCYARIAADRGVIGMVTSATRGVTMVPTFAAEPIMGPFELDMATTTVAAGKVRVYKLNHKPLPAGWVIDGDGKVVTDSAKGFQHVTDRDGGITPLGGSREAGSHKGYGLAVMVHVLAGTLAGASFSPIRNQTQKSSDPHNIGHFFMAIDPRAFRDDGEFEEDLDQVIDVLHNAKRVDADQPVLVAGDPERATKRERLESGVPVPDDLMEQLRAVAKNAGVPFVLAGG